MTICLPGFKDPETNAVTLRMLGPVGVPTDNPVVTLTLAVEYVLWDEAVERLR